MIIRIGNLNELDKIIIGANRDGGGDIELPDHVTVTVNGDQIHPFFQGGVVRSEGEDNRF